jgi:predicted permease
VAVLTHEYWQRRFGGEAGVVGRVIELTGVAATIVGVLEPGSHYAGTERAELYANYSTNSHYMSASMQDERRHRMTTLYGLVKRGPSIDQARAEMEAIAGRLHTQYPADYPADRGYGVRLTPWRDVLVAEARPTLLILMGAVALVLIVACANVANLTFARLVRREQELAVRAALGATAARLRAILLVEHLLLSVAGAAVGVVVAWVAMDLLVGYAARMTLRAEEVGLNPVVLAFSLVLGVGVAILFAWVPRLPAAGAAGAGVGGRTTVGRAERRMQRLLVAGQVAVSFVVLSGAGLLARSLVNLEQIDRGFDTSAVVALKAPNFTQTAPAQNRALFDEVTARLSAFPGVTSVATATSAPYDTLSLVSWRIKVQGASPELVEEPVQLLPQSVSPGYFETLRLPIVRGRGFGPDDTAGATPALVINQMLASRLFGDADPIGRQMMWSFNGTTWGAWLTIVGVARDVRELGPGVPPVATVYRSAVQGPTGPALLVRTAGDPAAVTREAARLVHALDPRRPVTDVWTLDTALGERAAPSRLNASLFGVFALVAVAIAAVGIAGVLAFAVSERTREFGIRLALGAEPGRLLRGVVRDGLLMTVAGLVAGVVATVLLGRFVEGLLFGVRPTDAATLASALGALVIIAGIASWIPARRVTEVDPNIALRDA